MTVLVTAASRFHNLRLDVYETIPPTRTAARHQGVRGNQAELNIPVAA